ncbi:MAG: cell filamentation protein Fic [Omnitrophica WOR_2 bacterium RIFCSPHIGHO2_02_FULL_68_15]|nr:MAG: cell filamentation protein Fic [Omnitrophica WOR_2 bacterium RIFCSPHIGHO2_02_FULL_68_15]
MKTFQQFEKTPLSIPAATSWYLADLGEARGRQALFTAQSPHTLKVLREHALIESAVSSNRIEGVTVQQKRVGTVVFGRAHLKDRDEEEVRAYRTALDWIHREGAKIPVSEKTILTLHRMSRGEVWDAGRYKSKNVDIIEKLPGGRERVRFHTVDAAKTPSAIKALVDCWQETLRTQTVHPLIALAAFNLDFLCIHPFRDGNGRVSRLLLLLQGYALGYEVGRYVSVERLIEQNKARYYDTLERSSQRWHDGRHDPWPYINYLLFILKTAYREMEDRVGQLRRPRGAKTALIAAAIASREGTFTVLELERACPGVSREMIRRVLRGLTKSGRVECLGRGPGAPWKKKGITPKRG